MVSPIIYTTQCNWGFYYKVLIYDSYAIICTLADAEESENIGSIKKLHFNRVFVGKSERNNVTERTKTFGDRYDGWCLLFEHDDNLYTYICQSFLQFKHDCKIQRLIGNVQNNLAVCAYCVDENNCAILFDEKLIIKYSGEDMYGIYYNILRRKFIQDQGYSLSRYKNKLRYTIYRYVYIPLVECPKKFFSKITKNNKILEICHNGIWTTYNEDTYADFVYTYRKNLGVRQLNVTHEKKPDDPLRRTAHFLGIGGGHNPSGGALVIKCCCSLECNI